MINSNSTAHELNPESLTAIKEALEGNNSNIPTTYLMPQKLYEWLGKPDGVTVYDPSKHLT